MPQGHADDRHDPDDLASGEYSGLRLPQQPIDVGEDVDTVAEEVSEFNWYNDSKADGGSGACQGQHGYAMPQAAEPEDRLDLRYRARASPQPGSREPSSPRPRLPGAALGFNGDRIFLFSCPG